MSDETLDPAKLMVYEPRADGEWRPSLQLRRIMTKIRNTERTLSVTSLEPDIRAGLLSYLAALHAHLRGHRNATDDRPRGDRLVRRAREA